MEGERVKGLCVVVLALVMGLAGCGSELNNENRTEKQSTALRERAETMKIRVTNEEYEIVYQLNDSTAAKGLYEQLPLTLEVKDFSTNEKTFYPPKELDVTDTPVANADKGTLAYYAPWADVVMFYDYFGTGNSLYELGEVVSGKENIENLQGTIIVEVVE